MRCPSCGCEYPDKSLKCPFCGTEHTKLAREIQQETLESLQAEGRDIQKNYHRQLRRNADCKVVRTGTLLLAGILGLLALILIGSLVFKLVQNSRETRNLEKLEGFLQEEDFAALSENLDKISDSYTSTYDKYRPVVFAYEDLAYAEESLQTYYDFAKTGHLTDEQLIDNLSWVLAPCFNVLLTSRQELKDQLIRGNESALELLETQAYDMLTQTLLLTEEEISELLARETSYYDYEDVRNLAKLSYERIQENL